MKILKRKFKKINIIRLLIVLILLVGLICIIWFYKKETLGFKTFLLRFINNLGIWEILGFIIIQIIQVTIPIIPGGIISIIGVILFGPYNGFIYNTIGVLIGSYLNFLLARKYGIDLVKKIVGINSLNKIEKFLNLSKNFEKIFAIAIFLPFAPDGIICYIAGITKMKTSKFLLIIFFLRPWSLLIYSLGGKYILEKFLL